MVLGFAFAGVTLALLALLVAPLLRQTSRPAREDYDLRIYRDQLDELDRDLARGVLGKAEAHAARLEVERRILAAANPRERDLAPALAERRVGLAAFLLVALPTFAGALYFLLGQPGLPGRPLSARVEAAAPPAEADIEQLLAGLRARLAEAPDDLRGWQLLGRTELAQGRADAAVEALSRAAELAPDDAETAEQLGEALVVAAQGAVTPAAQARFQQALAAQPGLPRASFYLGLARAQAGDLPSALDDWLTLLRAAAPDAPWRSTVEAAVRDAATELGRDPDALLAGLPKAPAAPGPSAEDVARMQALPPEQQTAAIRSMVDGLAARLEANPDDVQGWLRLGRARSVLGEPDLARAALDRALALRPDDPEVLAMVAMARLGPTDAVTQVPEVGAEAAELMTRWAAADQNAAQPYWYLGWYHFQAGRRDQTIAAWQAALERLPEDHPERPALEARLAEVRR